MKTITQCRSCNSPVIEPFFNLGEQPFANSLVKDITATEKKYSLSLAFCRECQLVQLAETADPAELFSNYFWVTGTSSTAREYADTFCNRVLDVAGSLKSKEYVLEVASNDGTFLKAFQKKGVQVLGVDPAKNIVSMANQEGVPTECGFFGKTVAENISKRFGSPKVAIARNVLPHVANLHDFVEGFATLLHSEGLLVLEVHYGQMILEELHYDSIYHEHLCYFSFRSLENLLKRYGFYVEKVTTSPISGGSIVVYAQQKKKEEDASVENLRETEEAKGTNSFEKWREFARLSFEHRDQLLKLLREAKAKQQHIVGYGASARSSTLLNFCGIGTQYVDMVADQNSLKYNLLTPGTHIPIQDPKVVMAGNPDVVFVLAWNFLDEISKILQTQYGFMGSVLAPLPKTPRLYSLRRSS